MSASRKANIAFEDEVRRVAEAVWGLQPGECNAAWYEGDPILHELDGIARMTDVTHLLMVTTSRKLEKVKDDVKKLNRAAIRKQIVMWIRNGAKVARDTRPVRTPTH